MYLHLLCWSSISRHAVDEQHLARITQVVVHAYLMQLVS